MLLVAQAINFFVVFAVLKFFAFDPITAFLKKRKEEIARGLAMKQEAGQRLKEIDQARERALLQARERAQALIGEAEQEGKTRQDAILIETQAKGERIMAEAKRLIREERAKTEEAFADDTKRLIQESVIRVLGMLPPTDRDRRLVEKAMQEVNKTLR